MVRGSSNARRAWALSRVAAANAPSKSSGRRTSSDRSVIPSFPAATSVSCQKTAWLAIVGFLSTATRVSPGTNSFMSSGDLSIEIAEPRHVSSGSRQVGDQAEPYRIAREHYDGDGLGSVLGRQRCRAVGHHQDIHVKIHKLRH